MIIDTGVNYLLNTKQEGGLPPRLLLSSKLELDLNFFCCVGPVQKTRGRFDLKSELSN